MGVRIVGVVVVDRQPFQPGSKLDLQPRHHFPDERLQVAQCLAVLGADDHPEVARIAPPSPGSLPSHPPWNSRDRRSRMWAPPPPLRARDSRSPGSDHALASAQLPQPPPLAPVQPLLARDRRHGPSGPQLFRRYWRRSAPSPRPAVTLRTPVARGSSSLVQSGRVCRADVASIPTPCLTTGAVARPVVRLRARPSPSAPDRREAYRASVRIRSHASSW